MSEYKLFVQRIGLVGFVNILISLSSLIYLPILTKQFSATEYGMWVQISTTMSLMPNLANLGLPYTMTRFLSGETKYERMRESFYSIISMTLLPTLIICILMLVFSGTIAHYLFNDITQIAITLVFIVFFACVNTVLLNYFRTIRKMKLYSLFLLLQTYIGVMIGSYLALSGYPMMTVVFATLISQFCVFIMMYVLIYKDLGFKIPEFKQAREFLNFGVPTVPNSVSNWIVTSCDTYIISIILGTAFVGYYSPAYSLGSLLLMFLQPFALLLPAILPQYYDKGDMSEVNKYMVYSMKYYLMITIPAVFGMSLLSYPILTILSTAEIAANGFLVTPWVCLGALLMGIYGITSNILVLEKRTKILGSSWIIASLTNIILNIILIPHFGIISAAITTLFSYTIAFTITIYYSRENFKLPFDYPFITKSIIAAIIMSIPIYLIQPTGIPQILITIPVAAVIYFAILIILKGIKIEEINFIKKLI